MMVFLQKEIANRAQGFTLVETLVSITILLMVIIGPMTIAQKGIQSAYYAGDQTTAIYLAQEAIEHFQRLRDDRALFNYQDYKNNGNNGNGNTADWYESNPVASFANCLTNKGCDVNFSGSNYSYNDCTDTTNCNLNKYNAPIANRLYGYSGGTASKFTRVIKIGAKVDPLGSSIGGIPVTVTVSWDASTLFGASPPKTITLQTYIYDHYTRFE